MKLLEEITLLHLGKEIIILCKYPNKDNFVKRDSNIKSAIIIPLIGKDYKVSYIHYVAVKGE